MTAAAKVPAVARRYRRACGTPCGAACGVSRCGRLRLRVRRQRHAAHSRGFTLIEVLVALAIVAIALATALRAVGSVAATTEQLHDRLLAGWSADNRLTEVHLQRAWPDFGTTNFPCPQGSVPLMCYQTVSPTPNPLFRRVEVMVRTQATGSTLLADFVTVVADETRRPL